jgi:hypothetical protein
VVVRFEFSGVPASRTKFRIMWLVLERSGADVCVKDPGFAIDLTPRGNISDYVAVYLGHVAWREVAGKALLLEGDRQIAPQLAAWLQLDAANGQASLGKRGPEHRQTASRLGFGRFILQNIPVFREHAVGHSEDIGRDPVSGSSSSRNRPWTIT